MSASDRLSALLLLALAATTSAAHAQESAVTRSTTEVAVANLVDQTGPEHLLLVADPVAVGGAFVWTANGWSAGPTLSLSPLRIGKRWGRLEIARTRAWWLVGESGEHRVSARVDGLALDEQYLCHDEDGAYTFVPPLGDLYAPSPGCQPEWLGYSFTVGQMHFREWSGWLGLRLLEAALDVNVLATGRTGAAFGERIRLRVGGEIDYVDFTDVQRPDTVTDRTTEWAARGLVQLDGTLTTPDPIFRVDAGVVWRPRLVEWDDQLVEGWLAFTLHGAPTPRWLVAVRLEARVTHSTRPWMSMSEWAPPTEDTALMAGLFLDLFYALPDSPQDEGE
ncbi:MAG TPA: hypothetical protein DEF51_09650 [Myxococcales bacterium]|nr:hypothetical protein [Myxococcales bacterium]